MTHLYASLHGYTFYRMNCAKLYGERMFGRKSQWCRLHALADLIARHEYILYLDTDAHVAPRAFDTELEPFLAQYGLNDAACEKQMLVSMENDGRSSRSRKYRACTGIFALRHCAANESASVQSSAQLLEEWWQTAEHPEWVYYKMKWPYDQELLNEMIRRYPQRIIGTEPGSPGSKMKTQSLSEAMFSNFIFFLFRLSCTRYKSKCAVAFSGRHLHSALPGLLPQWLPRVGSNQGPLYA